MEFEDITKLAQDCFQRCPTIILGSGASIPHGLPSMDVLGNYLRNNLRAHGDPEQSAWRQVKAALERGDHLEASLEGRSVPETLLAKIVALTWKCVNDKDRVLLNASASNGSEFALGLLLSRMFNSTRTELHVVTTNYDRVAEYACNSKSILFQTGFAPGYVQRWESTGQVRFKRGGNAARVVKIWKIHGSLDWFRTTEEKIVGLPVFELPCGKYTPLIVTPGLNKYETTYQDPFRTTINGADRALNAASAFLCVGFGFRDKHIHPKIIERCQDKNVPIVVLARKLTEEAKDFLESKAGTRYLGVEEHDDGSRVYSPEFPGGAQVPAGDLWSLQGFNSLVF